MAGWPYWYNYVRNAKRGVFSYSAIHNRLLRVRGSAKSHSCETCGSVASEWAYVGGSPFEREGKNQHGAVRVFSPRLIDYIPLCKKCHEMLDKGYDSNTCRNGHPINRDKTPRCLVCRKEAMKRHRDKKRRKDENG